MSKLRSACGLLQDLPGRFPGSGSREDGTYNYKRVADRVFEILREDRLDRQQLREIQYLIGRIPKGDVLLEFIDDRGWNLLQRAIMANHPDVVELLISRGFDTNAGVCSLPLHLACKLGRARIVQLLMDGGARVDIPSGVCHPVPHYIKYSSTGTGRVPKFRCNRIRVSALPVGYAIPNDHADVIKVLLTHKYQSSKQDYSLIPKVDYIYLLHESCRHRAKKCVKLLLKMYPSLVNERDKRNFTPLHYALRGPKDRECAILLLESDAKFEPQTFETDYGTLLHELYVSDDTSHFLKLTELILEKGSPELAKDVTAGDGDTPLHKLLKYFGATVPRNQDFEGKYVNEVVGCLKLLLQKGCDPNYANKKGESALHALLAHNGGRPLFHIRDRFGVGPKYLSSILRNICVLMEILLTNGANANQMSPPNFVTPLYYLVRVVCAMSPSLLKATAEEVKKSCLIMCKYGADPNVINAFGDNTLTLLLSSLSRWLYQTSEEEGHVDFLLSFTHDALSLFLSQGLDPQSVLRKNLKQFVIIFNVTIIDKRFITHMNRLLKLVISRGGNPNLIPFSESASESGSISPVSRKYSILYYLARGLYIHLRYQNYSALNILDIFSKTLHQEHLVSCVRGICTNLDDEFEQTSVIEEIKTNLKVLLCRPRCLKDIARMSIYNGMKWQIETRCHELPLPKTLIEYVVGMS